MSGKSLSFPELVSIKVMSHVCTFLNMVTNAMNVSVHLKADLFQLLAVYPRAPSKLPVVERKERN